jgi:hypothetical protein
MKYKAKENNIKKLTEYLNKKVYNKNQQNLLYKYGKHNKLG